MQIPLSSKQFDPHNLSNSDKLPVVDNCGNMHKSGRSLCSMTSTMIPPRRIGAAAVIGGDFTSF